MVVDAAAVLAIVYMQQSPAAAGSAADVAPAGVAAADAKKKVRRPNHDCAPAAAFA